MFYDKCLQDGWHYNKRFKVYQKVNGRVFCYVSSLMFGWQAQLYLRGLNKMTMCQTEVRTEDWEKIPVLFEMCEEWLVEYSHGDEKIIQAKDRFAVFNPKGVWMDTPYLKEYWI